MVLIDLMTPALLGKDASAIDDRLRDVRRISEYWSYQGAARHTVSAVEIALLDAQGKRHGVPVTDLFGGAKADRLPIYASGGDATTPTAMLDELDQVADLGATVFKIRARRDEVTRTAWTLREAASRGVRVGVDMYQNLADPPQSKQDVIDFVDDVQMRSGSDIAFLEEPLGVSDIRGLAELRSLISPEIAGGETMTRPEDLIRAMEVGAFDFVQPDATVIGGVAAVLEVCDAARSIHSDVVVHAWGGAVCLAANYHAAFAGRGRWAEYPLLPDALRQEMLVEPEIRAGHVEAPTSPGLGVVLTPELEERYPFRPSARYQFTPSLVPASMLSWK
jgi:L-alanine-DL-glutamate epimerase-like enolase superfamily enzyme